MKKHFAIFLTICITITGMNSSAQIPGLKIGSFDQFMDIGLPNIAGSALNHGPLQTYHSSGSGSNICFGMYSYSILSNKMKGDFILQTQVLLLGKGHEPHCKAGHMIRSSAAPNSPVVACTVHGDGLTAFQYRTTAGGTMQEIKLRIKDPDVLQLEKKGKTFTMSVTHFGKVYEVQKPDSINLGNDLFLLAGLFICAHNRRPTKGDSLPVWQSGDH